MPQQYRLDRIKVEGFKSIRRANVTLRNLNMLIGANGAGKSNLIAVFGLLNRILEERLQSTVRKVGAATLLHQGPKHTDKIKIVLEFGSNSYEVLLEYSQDDSLFFAHEICFFHDGKHERPYREDLGQGHLESRLAEQAGDKGVVKYVLRALRSWVIYHFHDTSDGAGVKRKGPIDDNERLRPDASNLAAFLYRLRETDESNYRRIVGAVRQVAPFFKDFRLRPDPLRPSDIQLEWSERDSDSYFNAHALSDGTLRFLCLATLLLQPDLPALVLVDEPELGLHPYSVVQLAELLKSAATRTQLLVATQSVTLLNQFDPEDILVVDRKEGQSTFERIGRAEISAWADSYSLGELWEKNVFGGRPRR